MASSLVLPQNPLSDTLNSYLTQHGEMELKAVDLITEYAAVHRAKQERILNAKVHINASFQSIINKLQTKQHQLINDLDTILNQNQSEQSVISSITSIINEQKQYLSPTLHSLEVEPDIKQISEQFNESQQLFHEYIDSLQQSMHTSQDNERITEIMYNVQNTLDSLSIIDVPSNEANTSVTSLVENKAYARLQSVVEPRCNYYYKNVSYEFMPFVTAINILTEYLPNKMIKEVFGYISPQAQFDEGSLKHGWEVRDDILHDCPDIYVENVKAIYNQPSLILTIGLPGSGKTTWAKIRCNEQQMDICVAADDYFDKYNDGEFKPSLLGAAHNWCNQTVYDALKCGATVVVNNTNTTLCEMYAYIARVVFGELPHKVVFAVMPETNIETLVKRGLHGVSVKKCKDMLKRMRHWLHDMHMRPSVFYVLKAGPFRRSRPRNMHKHVIFTGIFMDAATQDTIRRYFVQMSGEPLLGLNTDCHLTLKFQPLYKDVDMTSFGQKVQLKLVGYAMHQYIQCFVVDIIDDRVRSLCCNNHSHITVSYDPSVVRPNYANDLLDNGCIIPIINNFDIRNTANYTKMHRSMNDHDRRVNGGLIVEGTVGGFFRDPNGGVHFHK